MPDEVRWWPGRGKSVPAEVVVAEIRALEEEFGACQPAAFVERARSKASPVHELFEWDDSVAADKFRVEQAREIIRSVRVTFHEQEKAAPAFLAVKLQTPQGVTTGYVDTLRAMSDEKMRAQIVREALRQLRGWERRYRMLKELAKVTDVINRTLDEHEPD